MAKDWVNVVDGLLLQADRMLDKVRKKPRRRLAEVPTPIAPPDPFTSPDLPPAAKAPAAPAAAVTAAPAPKVEPTEAPLGDKELPAQIYGRRTDMWSGRAVQIFQDLGVDARFYNIDDPELRSLEARLIRDTKQYALPWVYVRGEFVGDYNALDELHRLGQLEERTLPEGERPEPVKRRVRIEMK